MSKARLDDTLIERGFFTDRDEALRHIIANEVLVDDVPATSGAQKVSPDCIIRLRQKPNKQRYVSRGGDKLKSAIDAFGVDVIQNKCLDIGSSTGGFTDCLLKEGAAKVVCVDVNYGQLDWTLRQDERVEVFERTNIKHADPDALGAPFDCIVIDVSFIGLAGLAPTIAGLAHAGSKLIALVKPQFESAHDETEGGVVTDPAVRVRTLDEVCSALKRCGFEIQDTMESPVVGPAGNVEYLVYALKSE